MLSHVARNADALAELLRWATTGVETPMYPTAEARAADIDIGAGRSPAEIVDDLGRPLAILRSGHSSAGRSMGAADPDGAAAAGRTIPARRVLWERLKELELHHVDLDAGYTPQDWAPWFVDRALAETLQVRPPRRRARVDVGHQRHHRTVRLRWSHDGHWVGEVDARLADRTLSRRRVAARPSRPASHIATLGMSTYSGKVVPGGPPAVRELAHLIVTKASVGPMDSNTYVLRCRDTGDELVIDAAAEPKRILALCGEGPLTRIVTTHRHPDHWHALAEVVAATGAATIAHAADAPAIAVPTDELVADGDQVQVGSCDLEVIHLVGHTPGSIALLYDDPTGSPHLYRRQPLPRRRREHARQPGRLRAAVRRRHGQVVRPLARRDWVYPGHGNDTTLGAERPHLEEWRERGW